mmetsp:Transcript_101988/g.297450  ORF Transcript_101988/g.297450 Transcript_101988/m.297450 type:complete len:223 (-) Transcript_101988:464-1132(-)
MSRLELHVARREPALLPCLLAAIPPAPAILSESCDQIADNELQHLRLVALWWLEVCNGHQCGLIAPHCATRRHVSDREVPALWAMLMVCQAEQPICSRGRLVGERRPGEAAVALRVREHAGVDLLHHVSVLGHPGRGHAEALSLVFVDHVELATCVVCIHHRLRLVGLRELDQPLEQVGSLPEVHRALLPHGVQADDHLLLSESLLRVYHRGHASADLVLIQ